MYVDGLDGSISGGTAGAQQGQQGAVEGAWVSSSWVSSRAVARLRRSSARLLGRGPPKAAGRVAFEEFRAKFGLGPQTQAEKKLGAEAFFRCAA